MPPVRRLWVVVGLVLVLAIALLIADILPAMRPQRLALIRKECAADAFCFAAVKFRSTQSLGKSFPATLRRRPGE